MRPIVCSLVLLSLAACSEQAAEAPSPETPAVAPSAAPTGAEGAVGGAPIAPSAVAPESPAASAAPSKAGPPVLNRVNLASPLRLVGTEPFWGADLGDGRLTLEAPDREPVRLAVGPPVMKAGEATWRATGATVTVTAAQCSDGMSDRTYPLTATIRSGGITWKGCAANAAAFRRAVGRESGEVR